MKKWVEKEEADSENLKWLKEFTKPCPNPKCNTSIEKNTGCNHMTCFKCKHQFCWLCLADDQNYKHTQGQQGCELYGNKTSNNLAANMEKLY